MAREVAPNSALSRVETSGLCGEKRIDLYGNTRRHSLAVTIVLDGCVSLDGYLEEERNVIVLGPQIQRVHQRRVLDLQF